MNVNLRPTISEYAARLRALPPDLAEQDILRPELRIYSDERISVYFTPFPPTPNPAGRVLLVGLTPGRYQLWRATMGAAEALRAGSSPEEASQAAMVGSFAGPLRANLVRMLDGIGLPTRLGIESSASLWTTHEHLQSSISALRHAVTLTLNGKNYSGVPRFDRHPVLTAFVDQVLPERIAAVPDDALVIPLGKVAGEAVARLSLDPERVLSGMPHPSGENGHRSRQFDERRDRMAAIVANWS